MIIIFHYKSVHLVEYVVGLTFSRTLIIRTYVVRTPRGEKNLKFDVIYIYSMFIT